MDIDFSKYIIRQKEKDTLYKPFPNGSGYALFAKTDSEIIKILFSNKETLEMFLKELGFDWGPAKDEFVNYDNVARLLKRYPELANAEEAFAADPQWPEDNSKREVKFLISFRGHVWEVEGLKSINDMTNNPNAVELREVDHPLHYDESNYKSSFAEHYPGENVPKKKDGSPKKSKDKRECKKGEHRDENGDLKKTKKSKANYADLWKKVNDPSTSTSKKKLPPWMNKDKEGDEKEDKKGGKKEDKKGDKKEKGKDGKKMPPWLKKKKSKAKYSELHRKVKKTSGDKEG